MANDTNSNPHVAEVVGAVLLGLAAMAIAWSTFQSQQWGDEQTEAYTESVRAVSTALDLLQGADTIKTFDQSVFIEILTSGVCEQGERGDEDACELLLGTMSDEGARAVAGWLQDGDSHPLESPAYLEALYGQGEAEMAASQQFFEEALAADENGDNFELASIILTAVLFFAGISMVISTRGVKWALLGFSGLLLIGSIGYAASLPLA